MKTLNRRGHPCRFVFLGVAGASLIALAGVFWEGAAFGARNNASQGAPKQRTLMIVDVISRGRMP